MSQKLPLCDICGNRLVFNTAPRPTEIGVPYNAIYCPDDRLPYHNQAEALKCYMNQCPSPTLREIMRRDLEELVRTRTISNNFQNVFNN